MRIAAIVNTASGSVPVDAADQLSAKLAKLPHSIDFYSTTGPDLFDQCTAAISSSADILIAWGGDGTAACVLSTSGPNGPPVLVLPGGTMNLLSKQIHAQMTDWEKIADAALSNIEPQNLSCGEIEGHRFYVAGMFGKLTGLNDTREELRAGHLVSAARALLADNTLSVETRLHLKMTRASETTELDAVAAAIALTDHDRPRLEAAAIDPDSLLDFLAIGLDAARRGWRQSDTIENEVASRIEISDAHGAPIASVLDGEPVEISSHATAKLIENAATVLAARDTS